MMSEKARGEEVFRKSQLLKVVCPIALPKEFDEFCIGDNDDAIVSFSPSFFQADDDGMLDFREVSFELQEPFRVTAGDL